MLQERERSTSAFFVRYCRASDLLFIYVMLTGPVKFGILAISTNPTTKTILCGHTRLIKSQNVTLIIVNLIFTLL